jgi:hypothetical protein
MIPKTLLGKRVIGETAYKGILFCLGTLCIFRVFANNVLIIMQAVFELMGKS